MSVEDLKDQLARLPRLALVAFAARCARRVRPLADVVPEDFRAAIDQAIAIAEEVARGKNLSFTVEAADAARAAGYSAGATAAAETAWAAAEAADAAVGAVGAADEAADAAEAAWAAAEAAARSADKAAARGVEVAPWAAAETDVQRLLALNLGEPGDPGLPIDPSESGPLGPLWPAGPPAWYTNPPRLHVGSGDLQAGAAVVSGHGDATPPAELPPLTVYLDPGDAPPELIEEFYLTLSALYEAHGGSGLKFVNDEYRSLVPEEVER